MARLGRPEIRAVSRSLDKLDLFAVGQDGTIVGAAWDPTLPTWNGWFSILGGKSTPGGTVTAVSRRTDFIDVFCVGTEGGVWTASWRPDQGWRGWWRIGVLQAPLGAVVSAVSSAEDFIDLFVTASDGLIMTTNWNPAANAWRAWQSVGGGQSAPGSPVTAISSAPGRIDLLVVGNDHKVYTTVTPLSGLGWSPWTVIGGVTLLPRTEIGAASRTLNSIDAMVVTDDGRLMTAALYPGQLNWLGWWHVANGKVSPGAPVVVISRSENKMDAFVTDGSGSILTAAWQFGDAEWRGWWKVGATTTNPDNLVACVSRRPDFLDIFTIQQDAVVCTAAWTPADTAWRGWWTVGTGRVGYTAAMVSDPQIGGWSKAADHRYGGKWQTHTVEGITFHGARIFIAVTTHDSECILYRFAGSLDINPELSVTVNNVAGSPNHVGDIDYHAGTVYVSLEGLNVGGTVGVLELDENLQVLRSVPLSGHTPGSKPPQSHCPWVAFHPWTGMLYTSDYDSATVINAYSMSDYTWQEAYSIPLSGADVAKVGGGAFDASGHLIMTSDAYDDVRSFNAVNGAYQGNMEIDTSSGEEVEGVAIWPTAAQPNAEVHVLLWKGPGLSAPGQWGDALRKIYAVPQPNNIQPHS